MLHINLHINPSDKTLCALFRAFSCKDYMDPTWSRWAQIKPTACQCFTCSTKATGNNMGKKRGGSGRGRWGPSCLIETNCSPLPNDTDRRPFVPVGLCWEQQKGNVLILARDKVRSFLLHPSYLSLCAHPLEQTQRLSSSGACYILLD